MRRQGPMSPWGDKATTKALISGESSAPQWGDSQTWPVWSSKEQGLRVMGGRAGRPCWGTQLPRSPFSLPTTFIFCFFRWECRESTGIRVRPLRLNYQSTGDFGESFAFLLQVLPLILCRFFFRLRAKTWTWKRGSHLMTMKQQEWGKSLVLKIDRKEILTGLGTLKTSQNRWTAQCQTWSVRKHPSFCLVRPQQLSSGYRQTFPIPN